MNGHTTPESGNALAGRDGPNFDRNAIQVDSGSKSPIYYVAGPSAMVTGVRQMLISSGISEEDIRAEEFAGYE